VPAVDEAQVRASLLGEQPSATPEEIQALLEAENAEVKSARKRVSGNFYADFFFYVNLAGFLIQALLVSRIFKYFGVRAALFVLPLIALGGYAAIGLVGGIALLRVAKTAENSTDYSLQNTVKQALYLPTSREVKYKAKAAIDTFFVRIGDAASAGLVALGLHVLGFSAKSFALTNCVLVAFWILVAMAIAREHKKLLPDDRQQSN
jgi:AAA family ATP:ADP antiporter